MVTAANQTGKLATTPTSNLTSNKTSNQTAALGSGGFGEFEGNLVYVLSSGSSHTEYWTLVNKFAYPVTFYIVPPNFSGSQTPPTLVFSELNGTIPAQSNLTISVIAYSPSWTAYLFDTNSSHWSGYATAYASGTTTNAGGASIALGTAKLIMVTFKPSNMLPTIITAVVIIVLIVAVSYYLYRRRKKSSSRSRK